MLNRIAALALSFFAITALAGDREAAGAGVGATAPIPDDVERFAHDFTAAMLSRDVDRIMSFYSRRYLHDGATWKVRRQFLYTAAPKISNYWLRFSEFKPIDKDHAAIGAYSAVNGFPEQKGADYQIVRENGKWRWLGNQKTEPRVLH